MSSELLKNQKSIPIGLRIFLAIAAIGMLFDKPPWAQSNPLEIAAAYGGPLYLGLIAIFGYTTGWWKHLTLAIGSAWAVLVLAKLLGFALLGFAV